MLRIPQSAISETRARVIRISLRLFLAVTLVLSAFAAAAPAQTGGGTGAGRDPVEESGQDRSASSAADDPTMPQRHFSIDNPENESAEEAERIYQSLKRQMALGYGLSNIPAATAYQRWTRYSTAPYRSSAHGNRFVNNYANAFARDYGKYEQSGPLPVGSIVAKDGFTVTSSGVVAPGTLALMEKMPAGFNAASGDWRYTMIMPDGSVFGTTGGEGSERVEFCNKCHVTAENNDFLLFLPEEYRR